MSDKRNSELKSAKDLEVYEVAYKLAMEIFELSKKFPAEEKFALTSQIRRSSRSVCLNLREAWAKRRYEAHFVSKFTDCDGENCETDSSFDFARDSGYISQTQHEALTSACAQIGRMLGIMIKKSETFLISEPHPSTSDHRPPTADL
jgi:four helix bundle protein